jgi:CheY-like chemotaxis protein
MRSESVSLRILLVEDEAMVAMLLEDMLIDLGHQVVAVVGRLGDAIRLD